MYHRQTREGIRVDVPGDYSGNAFPTQADPVREDPPPFLLPPGPEETPPPPGECPEPVPEAPVPPEPPADAPAGTADARRGNAPPRPVSGAVEGLLRRLGAFGPEELLLAGLILLLFSEEDRDAETLLYLLAVLLF